MMALVLFVPILLCATAAGLRLGRLVGARYCDDAEALIFGSALGLGVLSYAVLIFGGAGWLNRPFFVLVLLIGLAAGVYELYGRARGTAVLVMQGLRSTGPLERALVAAVGAVSFLALCGALAPAIGQDELCYHLAQPRNYVREGAVYEVPHSVNALWPFLMQMLFTLGELFAGAELAKLFHYTTYLLTGAAIASWVRRSSGPGPGILAGAVYLPLPGALIQAGFAYIDNALALYTLLAVYAVSVYADSRERGWLLLSGLCAGLAVSTKLIGLFGVFAVLLLLVVRALGCADRRRGFISDVMIFGSAAFVAGAAWYIRSWILRGNPVFPFYPQLFGGHGWNDATYVDSHGRGQDLWAFLMLPWDMTLHPEWFGGEHIGPLFLAFLPGAILLTRKRAHVRRALGCAAIYAVCWFIVDPNIRFYYAGLALAAVGIGEALHASLQERRRSLRVIVGVLLVATALFSVGLAARHFGAAAYLLIRPAQRTAYLEERERSHAVATAFAPYLLGDEDKILSLGEVRGYYFSRPFVLEGDFALFTRYGERYATAEETVDHLRDLGFTHVLSSDLDGAPGRPAPYGLYAMLRDPGVSQKVFRPVARTASHGIEYHLYQIKDERRS